MAETWPYEVKWDAVDARFSPPPELDQPLPRRVRPRNGGDESCRARMERGCLSGCMLPIFVLGVLMVLWSGLAALIMPLGTPTTGTITGREPGNGSDSTYFLKFGFRAGSGTYNGEWQVRTERWKRTRVGDPVHIRYFSFAPGMQPVIEDGLSPWSAVFGLGPFGLFIAAIGSLPFLTLFERRSGKRLVRRGLVAPAFVVKCDNREKKITFLIRDKNGRAMEVEVPVKDVAYHYAGQTEVALFPKGHPEKARLYRWLDWQGVPPRQNFEPKRS